MKTLVIALVLGILGYFIFIYKPNDENSQIRDVEQTENQKMMEEMGVEETSYRGIITDTFNNYKSAVKDVVTATEKRY